jgi:endonuclease-3
MKQETLVQIIKILNKRYKFRFHKSNPFKLLIGVLLSHRTRDEVGWPASDRLFNKAKNLGGILNLSTRDIEKVIYPVGFYRTKAKRIKQICRILKEKYRGKVPKRREELMELPGIGPKSADIVLSYAYGQSVIAVDTHVSVISKRWHLTEQKEPEKIREDLHSRIPIKYRLTFNDLLVQFGKEFCTARYPKCKICPIFKFCPYESKNL